MLSNYSQNPPTPKKTQQNYQKYKSEQKKFNNSRYRLHANVYLRFRSIVGGSTQFSLTILCNKIFSHPSFKEKKRTYRGWLKIEEAWQGGWCKIEQ